MWFVVCVEILSIFVSASTLFIVTQTIHGIGNSYETKRDENVEATKRWILKILKANDNHLMQRKLVAESLLILEDSMTNDFNLIIEEFPFYQIIPPKLQTIVINELFGDFMDCFSLFFKDCEQGFKNELIVNMSIRRYLPD